MARLSKSGTRIAALAYDFATPVRACFKLVLQGRLERGSQEVLSCLPDGFLRVIDQVPVTRFIHRPGNLLRQLFQQPRQRGLEFLGHDVRQRMIGPSLLDSCLDINRGQSVGRTHGLLPNHERKPRTKNRNQHQNTQSPHIAPVKVATPRLTADLVRVTECRDDFGTGAEFGYHRINDCRPTRHQFPGSVVVAALAAC